MAITVRQMKIEDEWVPNSPHRSKGIEVNNIFQRDIQGRSVEFNITRFDGSEFFSPAHRHNFDQLRIGLEGVMNYTGRHKLAPRVVAYYPEGTWYGPMTCEGPSISAIMQFDGADHNGYVTLKRMDVATEALRQEGTFKKGYFHPNDGSPKIDGYQASWERVTGKKMIYSDPPRYLDAVYMHIDSFKWLPLQGGIKHKTLGRFGERDFTVEIFLLPKGETLIVDKPGRQVSSFVLTGSVEIEGKKLPKWSGSFAEENDKLIYTGIDEESEILVFTLPDLG